MTFPDKSKFVGEFVNNARTGKGTYFYANGDRFCGIWENGVKQGQGVYVFADSGSQVSFLFLSDNRLACVNE